MDIPLSEIRGTRIPNIRQQEHGVDYVSLRESLARDGQLHAISVVPDGAGHFLRVTGSQRFHAATELGWPTIKAVVHPAEMTDEEAHYLNAIENTQRRDLPGYDIACHAKLMTTTYGTSSADYARRIGLYPSRVQTLVRCCDRLPPDIIEAWRSGDELLTDQLYRLSRMPHDEASESWAEWRVKHAHSKMTSPRDRSRPRRNANRPTDAVLHRLGVAVKRNKNLNEGIRGLLLLVIEFCQGLAATVPGLFDPPCEADKSKSKQTNAKRQKNAAEAERELPFPDRGQELDPEDLLREI